MDDVLGHRFFDGEGGWRMSALPAAALNDTAEMRRILDKGAVPVDSIEHLLEDAQPSRRRGAHADVVEMLLEHGATPDECDGNKRTPMHALVLAAGDASSCPEEATLAPARYARRGERDIDGQDVLT